MKTNLFNNFLFKILKKLKITEICHKNYEILGNFSFIPHKKINWYLLGYFMRYIFKSSQYIFSLLRYGIKTQNWGTLKNPTRYFPGMYQVNIPMMLSGSGVGLW